MAKQLQLRRGTTAQHATFTGAVGEVTIDTDKDVVVVHDGATAGGFPSQKELISGTNIKTINNTSLLGSGDISMSVTNIDEMKDFVATDDNYALNVLGYHEAGDGGGGLFYWDATKDKAEHNGGTVIDPTVAFPTDWNNQTQLATWFDTANTGTGCWVRQYSGAINIRWFGAKGIYDTNSSNYDQKSIRKAIDFVLSDNTQSASLYIPTGNFYYVADIGTYNIDCVANQKSIILYGDGESSKLSIDGDNKIFNVSCNLYYPFVMKHLSFKLLNQPANTNATFFYITHSNYWWGAVFYISDCKFESFTNSAIHAIRAFNSKISNSFFVGNSQYNSTGTFTQVYDDACVRFWGADGTNIEQDHSFSNLNVFENNYFQKTKYGIDGWGIVSSTVNNCGFEHMYIGIINRKNTGTVNGIGVSTDKSGYNYANLTINTSWYENIEKFDISVTDINSSTGEIISPTFVSYITMNDFFALRREKENPAIIDTVTTERFVGFSRMDGTLTDHTYLSFFTNNPDQEHYKFTTLKAEINPVISATSGISFSSTPTTNNTLSSYLSSSTTVSLRIGTTLQTTGEILYEKIGNICHFSILFYKENYIKSGTGDVTITGLPYVSSAYNETVIPIGDYATYTPTTQPYAVLLAGTSTITLYKSYKNVVTNTDIANGTILLRISGSYRCQ